MGRISSHYNWHNTGKLVFWDKATFETTHAHFGFSFYDDFAGSDVAIPAAASPESGCKWVKKITSAHSTVVSLAGGCGGVMSCNLEGTSEKQEAGLYMNDQRNFDISKGLIFECRLALHVLPTDVAEIQWGLAGDYVETIAGVTYALVFDADGGGAIKVITDDNATPLEVATGLTVLADAYHIYRIDCTDITDIKFFIDGVEYCSTTTFPYAATGANAILQPYFYAYKATGTGVGSIYVDYVKIWQNR